MKKLVKSVSDWVLFSNFFIALCAVAQGLVTFHLIGAKPVYPVLAILFAATLGVYNFSILITKPAKPMQSPHYRVRWFFKHYTIMVAVTVVAFLSLLPLFFYVSLLAKVLLLFMTVLSIGYSLPLFKLGNTKLGLRHIPGLKPFLITIVWTLSGVLLPVLEAQNNQSINISAHDTAILIAKRFLFIGALTIPFDVRDLFDDQLSNLKTIPVAWGERNAYLFCQVLLAGYIVLLFLFMGNGFSVNFIALTTTALLTGWLIFRSKWEKNELYYFFYMDGVLILQYVFLVAFSTIAKHL